MLALSAQGILPKVDYAIFADTGWESESVYAHLDRLEEEIAAPAGIPVLRVSAGNIRDDALNPDHRFASMPLHILNKDGRPGMTRRQCTGEYKVKPIKQKVRELLGYPYPARIPKDVFVEQWVGISTDEFHRAKDADVKYMRNRHPLLDMSWSRADCVRYLASLGLADTPKSSCLGCLMWNRGRSPCRPRAGQTSGRFVSIGTRSSHQEQQPCRHRYNEDRDEWRQAASLEEEDERLWSVRQRHHAQQCQSTDGDYSEQPLCPVASYGSGYRAVPMVHLRSSTLDESDPVSHALSRL
ncbi:hypothetical protein ACH4D3_37365 [Streptomyces sp. NPDC018026]|uniref:hypothetical protein n=1 Tax=Streptomyces sp. NPDC018026 TaxID=3365031 RepID=UPI00379493F6